MKKRARSKRLSCPICDLEMKQPCRLTEKGREWYCWSCNEILETRDEIK